MIRICKSLILLAAFTPLASALAAAGSATVQAFDADGDAIVVQIEGLDARHLRLSSPQHPEAYLVMLDGTPYNVIQFGSLPLVMDANEMFSQMGARMPSAPAPADDIRSLVSLTPTGEKETVAGVVGERYRLKYLDSAQQPHEEELVVSRDPLLHDLGLALYHLGNVVSRGAGITPPEGTDRLVRDLDAKGLGLLRMGTRMRVLSLNRTPPAAARFVLPAPPMQAFPPLDPSLDAE